MIRRDVQTIKQKGVQTNREQTDETYRHTNVQIDRQSNKGMYIKKTEKKQTYECTYRHRIKGVYILLEDRQTRDRYDCTEKRTTKRDSAAYLGFCVFSHWSPRYFLFVSRGFLFLHVEDTGLLAHRVRTSEIILRPIIDKKKRLQFH
jgi:hypothetical protein